MEYTVKEVGVCKGNGSGMAHTHLCKNGLLIPQNNSNVSFKRTVLDNIIATFTEL